MARPWRKRLLIAAAVIALLVIGCDRSYMFYWVGHTDLDVTFVVTDAVSGEPVRGAEIEIQSNDHPNTEDAEREFLLVNDTSGIARRECPWTTCSGAQSGLYFTNTYVVHLPHWCYRAGAVGYELTEWAFLTESWRQVRRVGPGETKLVIPILLHKQRAKPNAAGAGGP
ncbi:hypothetical protein [Fimbriiglobus ruber]|uniref:hypothetical protein n=1 Tax=Fimbriiglobus ruber TaxID=1908690 RepID=UPI000B4BBEA8|nr:hypothetical protein [Fimbriiglobus ruber]